MKSKDSNYNAISIPITTVVLDRSPDCSLNFSLLVLFFV